jgi:hypothetical protein
VAVVKETAVGHKRVCVEAAAGGEVCTRRPKGRRSLLCDCVREANTHGEAMVARPTGTQHQGPAQEKGPKAHPRLPG